MYRAFGYAHAALSSALRRVRDAHGQGTVEYVALILLVGAALLLGISTAALAADYYVDITNRTGYTIMYMYVSPAKSDSWEEDVLGKDVLPNGETRRVNLRNYRSPIFDIRLVDSDGDKYTFWNIDVSKEDVTVTLDAVSGKTVHKEQKGKSDGTYAVFVLDGTLKVSVIQPNGRELTLALLGPGEIVGEIAQDLPPDRRVRVQQPLEHRRHLLAPPAVTFSRLPSSSARSCRGRPPRHDRRPHARLGSGRMRPSSYASATHRAGWPVCRRPRPQPAGRCLLWPKPRRTSSPSSSGDGPSTRRAAGPMPSRSSTTAAS